MMPSRLISLKGALLLFGTWLSWQAQAQRFDWQTFAGSSGGQGLNDGTAQVAHFSAPQAVVSDAGGTLYIADANNHSIRATAPDGTTRTLAGKSGTAGSRDGLGAEAQFRNPGALAVSSTGRLIVADTANHTIRRVETDGRVSTVAGAPGMAGNADGAAGEARFNSPRGIVTGPDGSIYVADSQNHTIRRIAPDGVVTTLAGAAGVAGAADGPGISARFRSPRGLAMEATGVIFVADLANHTIRRISPEGLVTTLAGQSGVAGFADGIGTAARFRSPAGVAVGATGQIYVADGSNHAIRRISPEGVVATLAGAGGIAGFQNGQNQQALFRSPAGVGLTPAGMVVVADTGNHALRVLSPAGDVTTLAGRPRLNGSTDGVGIEARFNLPAAIARAPDGSWAVAEEGSHTLRRITTGASVTLLTGAPGAPGLGNGTLAEARFNAPAGLCYGSDGSLYVGDTGNRLIRLITPGGEVSTLAGTFAPLPGAAGIPAYEQRLIDARGIALDEAGRIYVTDNNMIRRVIGPESFVHVAGPVRRTIFTAPSNYVTFWEQTVRGQGDGSGSNAMIRHSKSPVCDSAGNIYFADAGLHTIRRCTPDGLVTTLAGAAQQSGSADGTSTGARFSAPAGLTLAADGSLYVADSGNHLIRRVSPMGVVTTVGGLQGYAGSGEGRGVNAQFANPTGITMNADGSLLVADRDNHRLIRGRPVAGPQLVVEFNLVHLPNHAESALPGMSLPGLPSAPVSVQLRNTGTSPLRLDSLTLEGEDAGIFTFAAPAPGTMLAPEAAVNLTLSFLPPGVGLYSTSLKVQSDDPEQPDFQVRLIATGNHPPSCPDYTITARAGELTSLAAVKVLAHATDPDGQPLRVTAVGPWSTAGTRTWLNDVFINYEAQSGQTGTDSFQVTISDTLGGQTTATIRVTISAGNHSLNPAKLVRLEAGQIRVTFHGIPGRNYAVQRSADLLAWQTVVFLPASPTGLIEWTDAAPLPDSGYYRLAMP